MCGELVVVGRLATEFVALYTFIAVRNAGVGQLHP
jgi:hypothetical protein